MQRTTNYLLTSHLNSFVPCDEFNAVHTITDPRENYDVDKDMNFDKKSIIKIHG